MMHAQQPSLAEHLRELTDDKLTALLTARPDLAAPPPSDFDALARRAHSPSSLARALETLDQFTLLILDGLRLSPTKQTTWEQLLHLLGPQTNEIALRQALRQLETLGVIWRSNDPNSKSSRAGWEEITISPSIDEVCSPHPAGLGRPLAELSSSKSATEILALLAEVDPEEKAVLQRLVAGPPIGLLPDANKTGSNSPVRRLIKRGLLIAVDDNTVELPREVGLELRGQKPLGAVKTTSPTLPTREVGQDRLDRGGAGQVQVTVQRAAALLAACANLAPTDLRSGGIGQRELRRLATTIDLNETHTALLLELCHQAQLLGKTDTGIWLPTIGYDQWHTQPTAHQWNQLAQAWLQLPRLAEPLTKPDEKRPAPLSPGATHQRAVELRQATLAVFAELPTGHVTTPSAVIEVLTWRTPRRYNAPYEAVITTLVSEAAELGLLARDRDGFSLTHYSEAILDGEDPSELLAKILPAPVDHILVQADFSVIAPGPLEPALAAEMALVADVESAGGAIVYRVNADTLRRAFDSGRSAADLHTFFATRSRTPIPQALDYLIDDVGRRHAGLRIGAARSYLRSDDETTIAAILADSRCAPLGLRRLTSTVVISPLTADHISELLKTAGYTTALEDNTGALVIATQTEERAPSGQTNPLAQPHIGAPQPRPPIELAEVIAGIRRGDNLIAQANKTDSQRPKSETDTDTIMRILQAAVRERKRIQLGFVDAHGGIRQRLVRPLSIGSGYLRAEDERTDTTHTFALQRIISVIPPH